MGILLLRIGCFFRKVFDPILWWIFKTFFFKKPTDVTEEDIEKFFKNDIYDFNLFMKNIDVKYKHDPCFGIFDYTLFDLRYFLSIQNEKSIFFGRDCDDYAYFAMEFLKRRPEVSEIYFICGMDGCKVKTSHCWLVYKNSVDNNYRLWNYKLHPKSFSSVDEACQQFAKESLVASGQYDKVNYLIYDKFIKGEQK